MTAELNDTRGMSTAGGLRLSKTVALVSLVVLAGSYVINAMDRQVFAVLLPGIRAEYGFSLGQGGLLATIFTLGIGIAGLPTGYLLDRLSRKSVIMLGIAIYSAFTMLTAVSAGFGDMAVYRAASGIGEAMQNGALFSAVGAYFFANRAMALGALNFAYGIGGFLGPLLGSSLAGGGKDWRVPFWVYGLIGFVFIAIIAVVIRKAFTEQKDDAGAGPVMDVENVPARLYNRNILVLGLVAIVIGVSMYGYLGLYPSFLVGQLHFSSGTASWAASMFGLGALVGIPAGWIGDRLNQRTVIFVAILAGSVVGYLLFNGPTTPGAQYLLSFLEGAVASGFLFVNIYAAMQRSVRPEAVGRASGIFVATFYVPAALAGYLFSAFVSGTGWGGAGLWQLTILPLAGALAILFLDPRKLSRVVVSAHH